MAKKSDGVYAIAVLDRGFVYVGLVDIYMSDLGTEWIVIRDARNIRRWGTTRGLGQLALEGPTSATTLDPVGVVRAPARSLVSILETEERLWNRS